MTEAKTPLALADFLLARIAEDEALVRDKWDSDAEAVVGTVWTGPEPGYTTVASRRGDGQWIADGRPIEDARHATVLFDPARVLAECEAKRRIVLERIELGTPCNDEGAAIQHWWTLRLLALPYADHPDYREEWRP